MYLLKYSCADTLNIKHGKRLQSYHQVFKKYGKDLTIKKEGKIIAKFSTNPCKKSRDFNLIRRFKVNPLVYLGNLDRRRFRSLKVFDANCFACGSAHGVEIHHVRKLSDLKGKDHLSKQ